MELDRLSPVVHSRLVHIVKNETEAAALSNSALCAMPACLASAG
jgi:hypothetical protein